MGDFARSLVFGAIASVACAAVGTACRARTVQHIDATPTASSSMSATIAPIAVDDAGLDGESDAPVDAAPDATHPELPRGGRTLFPQYRLVGFCGTLGGAPALGRLDGNLTARAKTIQGYADQYAHERKPMPVFELIAVVAMGFPGPDNMNRRRVPDGVVDSYLSAARAAHAILLLNIQPGHSDFMTEVKHFEKYLHEPDVGLALDPEWEVPAKVKPGAQFGQTSGAEINAVGEYLAAIIKDGDLPEKALVFHQVNGWVLKNEADIASHDGVVLIKSVDGLGQRESKIKTYNFLMKSMPTVVHAGMKLFFDEDTAGGHKLMTPDQVLALQPMPEYVMYE